MPYRCTQIDKKWQLQKQGQDGNWTKVADHSSYKNCKAQIRAIGASKHAKVENKCKLKIHGYIGDFKNSLEYLDQQLLNVRGNEVLEISINSNGGSYIQAMKIYDRLSQHGGKKRIRIAPIASSAGAVLALSPEAEVSIPENGLLYHHAPEIAQNEAKNPEELRKMADELETVGSTLVAMIVARTDKDEAEVKQMLNEGRWFTAQQAKDYGLVDIIEPLSRRKTVIRNLVLPEQIVAHVETLNKRSEIMALKDVCHSLELEITDEMTEDQLEEAIVNSVTDLRKKLEEKPKEKEKPKNPPNFSDGILNLLVTNREMEITNLVSEGKITPAVGDKLKAQFAKKEEILNCVDEDGNSIDNFESVIAALKDNEKVLNFGGKTKTPLPKPDDQQQESALVLNAKARGAG